MCVLSDICSFSSQGFINVLVSWCDSIPEVWGCFCCVVDVCRHKLTCLRLHGEIRLSLQYAVHQPGTVAIGRVISICSCHLHHWCTYRTDTWTWQTSQEMALYLSAPVSKIVWQTSLFADPPACTGKNLPFSQTLQLNCISKASLPSYSFHTFHHCQVKTSSPDWFSCFKNNVSSVCWQSRTTHGFMKPFHLEQKKVVVKLTKYSSL